MCSFICYSLFDLTALGICLAFAKAPIERNCIYLQCILIIFELFRCSSMMTLISFAATRFSLNYQDKGGYEMEELFQSSESSDEDDLDDSNGSIDSSIEKIK